MSMVNCNKLNIDAIKLTISYTIAEPAAGNIVTNPLVSKCR